MPLSPAEERELADLEAWETQQRPSGLAPDEETELAELEKWEAGQQAPTSPEGGPSVLEAAVRSPIHGVTLGQSDKVAGFLGALTDKVTDALGTSGQAVERYTSRGDIPGRLGHVTEGPKERTFEQQYNTHRDEYSAANQAAEAAHPDVYGFGEFAGSMAIPTGPVAGLIAKGASKVLKPVANALSQSEMVRAAITAMANSPLPKYAGAIMGAPSGVTGMAAGYASGKGVNELAKKALTHASPVITKADSAIQSVAKSSANLSPKYSKILSEAAARGGNSLAITHFLLSNEDPEYQAEISQKP